VLVVGFRWQNPKFLFADGVEQMALLKEFGPEMFLALSYGNKLSALAAAQKSFDAHTNAKNQESEIVRTRIKSLRKTIETLGLVVSLDKSHPQ
jgi:hypothetical protein